MTDDYERWAEILSDSVAAPRAPRPPTVACENLAAGVPDTEGTR